MDFKRIVAVTLGLAMAGLVVGGVLGALLISVWMLVAGEGKFEPRLIPYTAAVGGMMGVVLGPLSAWLLMRYVPIGLAIGGTALGTLAGAAVGIVVGGLGTGLTGGLIGFAVTALLLGVRASRDRGRERIAVPRGPST